MARYILYSIGCLVVFLLIGFAIWHCSRKRHMMQVQNKILQLRLQARPENIIKDEIKTLLRHVTYKVDKKARKQGEDPDTCVICCEEFKNKQTIICTQCKHLFHDECLWQWIDSKLQRTMTELQIQARNDHLPSVPHPPKDCIECPLCN